MKGLATVFGLGRIGMAPGTFGSLAALPFGAGLHYLGSFPLFLIGLIAVTGLGWISCAAYLRDTGTHDPGEVIIDEVAGQMVALAPLSLGLWLAGQPTHVFPWPGWVGAFLLFRFFDIVKPPPVSWAERAPGATGVMLDDLVAGALSAALILLAAGLAHGWFP